MKILLIFILICIYSPKLKTQPVLYFAFSIGDYVLIDNSINFDENSIGYLNCKKIITNQRLTKASNDYGDFYFNPDVKSLPGVTKELINAEYYISGVEKVIKSKVSDYLIWSRDIPMEYSIDPYIKSNSFEPNEVLIVTNNSAISKIDTSMIYDLSIKEEIKMALTNYLGEKNKEKIETSEIKIIKGSFTKNSTNYAVSINQCNLDLRPFPCCSGLFIVEGDKVIIEMIPFEGSDDIRKLIGVIDIDGDGLDDLILGNHDIDGFGWCELWRNTGKKFTLIKTGFQ